MTTPINKVLTNQTQTLSNEELANVSASLSAILGQGGGSTYSGDGQYINVNDNTITLTQAAASLLNSVNYKLNTDIYAAASATWEDVANTYKTYSGDYLVESATSAMYYPLSGNPSGFMDKLFTAEYNVTPYSDIKSAYDAGKIVYCAVPVTGTKGNNYRMAFLAYANITGGDFEFQYYRSKSSKSLTAQNDELIVYKCASANGWQAPNSRATSVPITAGNGLSATYTGGTLRLDVTATGGLSEVSAVAPLSGDGSSEHPLGIDMSSAYSIDGAHGITAIPNTADNKVIVQMTDDVWAYYQRLAASANVWDSASAIGNKSKTVINNSVNTITTENSGTSATLSAVEYKVNTSFQNAAPKQLFVVQDDNDIYSKLSEVNGKGSLFFVCSAI